MFASIIPRIKTPLRKDAFTYRIPEGFSVKRGSVVRAPFRGKEFWGVVESLSETVPPYPTRDISFVHEQLVVPEPFFLLLNEFASYYRVSKPSAFHTMSPDFTQEIKSIDGPNQKNLFQATLTSQSDLVQRVKNASPTVVRFQQQKDAIAFYLELVNASTKPVLILAPSDQRMEEIASAIQIDCKTFSSTYSRGQATVCWRDVNLSRVWVGTKLTAFLPFDHLGTIIIDQEEDESHKQWDQNPRWDVRFVATTLATIHHARLISVSPAPRVETRHAAAQFIDLISKKNAGTIVSLAGDKGGLLSGSLMNALETSNRALIIYNRKGLAKFHVCSTCKYTFSLEEATCPNCKGSNFFEAGIGTKELQKRFIDSFPKKTVGLFDADHPNPPEASIELSTVYAINHARLGDYDLVVVLLADQFLNAPSFRSHERAFGAISYLARECRKLLIQTYQPDHPTITAALSQNYDAFYQAELPQQTMLGYPPFGIVTKVMNKKTGTERWVKEDPKTIALLPGEIIDINPD